MKSRLLVSALLLTVSLQYAVTHGETLAQPATPTAEIVNDFSVSVGNRDLFVSCEGTGSPTVVQEIGGPDPEGGVSAIDEGGKIVSGWLGGARFCGYDRAGTGSSPADPAGIRTLTETGADLLAVLAAPEINCPCVVMAESLGGGIALAAIAEDASNFAGLVLVDSLLPGFSENVLELAPPGSAEAEMVAFFEGENEEAINYHFSSEMLPSESPGIPVRVLTHGMGGPPPCPCSDGYPTEELENIWQTGQSDLAILFDTEVIVAKNSGHFIAVDEPELVVDAILQVIAEVQRAALSA